MHQLMKSYFKYLVLILPILIVSCVTSKRVNLMQEPDSKKIPSYTDTLSYEDYRLRIGDRLYSYVYSVDERISNMFNASSTGSSSAQIRSQLASGRTTGSYDLYTYLVKDNGAIDFPMVGDVVVRGKTTREVKLALEDELATYIHGYGEQKMLSVEVNVVQRMFSVISDLGSGTFTMQKE